MADLGADAGHRVLRVTRKGARKAKVPLTPATVAAVDAYLADRATRAGLDSAAALSGPLLATASGGSAPAGPPVGAGPPPRPGCRRRDMAGTVAALAAALGDHFRP